MKNLFTPKKTAKTADKSNDFRPFEEAIEDNTLEEQKKGSNAKNKGITFIFLIVVAFFALGITFRSILKNNQTSEQNNLSSLEQKKDTPDFNNLPVLASEPELPEIDSIPETPEVAAASDIQSIPVTATINENPAPSQKELRLNAPLMAGNSGGGEPGSNQNQNERENQTANGMNGLDENENTQLGFSPGNKLGSMLNPTVTIGTMAGQFGNLNLILNKGTFIPCNLKTKLDTQVAGMLSCVLPRDIYSSNGKVVLLERGSVVTGEFQKATEMGMNRIFVLWTRIQTPKGVYVNIDSPATDELGGSGVTGKVNNHWWKRFGNALLFSMIQDGITSGFERLARNDNSNNNIVYSNSQSTSDEIIKEILKSTSNIPPTIYRGQGSTVGIYLSRDLNFESVYKLRIR